MFNGLARYDLLILFLFWLTFWPNMLLSMLWLQTGEPHWLQSFEPFLEYVVSFLGWLLLSALIAVIIHATTKLHRES